jgi:p-aminobenzoyl-glutamate transporter AbgT
METNQTPNAAAPAGGDQSPRWVDRALNAIETIGNKLPDPAVLFLILLIIVWLLSWLLAPMQFAEIDPRTNKPIQVVNQLSGTAIAAFLSTMVTTFTGFHPLGVVLVALLGVGVAERTERSLTAATAPLMQAIVPLIFLLFLLPGVVFGYVAGTVKSHRDIIKGMSKSMSTMGYYIVLAFFASLFIAAFGQSNIGALLALKGANVLRALELPGQVTIVGIIILTALVNLLIGSASAKWALLAPIFVPMLMQLGLSPELTQAAYRVGDSTTNIITPLMPYFPLVVVYGQRYVKNTGIGTLVSLMLPFSLIFLVIWTIFLIVYWLLGLPLGLQAPYAYPAS